MRTLAPLDYILSELDADWRSVNAIFERVRAAGCVTNREYVRAVVTAAYLRGDAEREIRDGVYLYREVQDDFARGSVEVVR